MATHWILSEGLVPVTGKVLKPLLPVLRAIPEGSDSTQIDSQLAGGAGADAKKKAFALAFGLLNNKKLEGWFSSWSALEKLGADDRLMDWPKVDLQESATGDEKRGNFNIVLSAGAGIKLAVDASDDVDENDVAAGSSGSLHVLGNIGGEASVEINTNLSEKTIGLNADARGKETATYELAVMQPQKSAALIAGSILASIDKPPSDLKALANVLHPEGLPRNASHGGSPLAAVSKVILRREAAAGLGADVKVPFQLSGANFLVSGEASFKATRESRLELSISGNDLVAKLKGDRVTASDFALGLSVGVGISSFGPLEVKKIAALLGDAGKAAEKLDDILELGGETLLKPGNLIKKTLEKKLESALGGKDATGIIAALLDVKEKDVAETLTESLIGIIDDQIDVFELEKGSALRVKAQELLGTSIVTPIIGELDQVFDDVLKDLQAKLDKLAKKQIKEVLEIVGRDTTTIGSDIAGIRRFLTMAREQMTAMVTLMAKDMELGISLGFVGGRESSETESVAATLVIENIFGDPGDKAKELFEAFVKNPNRTLSEWLKEAAKGNDIAPEGVRIDSVLKKKTEKKSAYSGWEIRILNVEFGQTVHGWTEMSFIGTLEGIAIVGSGGATGTSRWFKRDRVLELANIVTFGKGIDAQGASTDDEEVRESNLAVRLVASQPRRLDEGGTIRYLNRLDDASIISSHQNLAVMTAIRKVRSELGSGKQLAGKISVDMKLDNATTRKVLSKSVTDIDGTRSRIAEQLIKHGGLLEEVLIQISGDISNPDLPNMSPKEVLLRLAQLQRLPSIARQGDNVRNTRWKPENAVVAGKMLTDLSGALGLAGRTMEADDIGPAKIDAVNERFAGLGRWTRPAIPIPVFGPVSGATIALFDTVKDLTVLAGAASPATVVTLEINSGEPLTF